MEEGISICEKHKEQKLSSVFEELTGIKVCFGYIFSVKCIMLFNFVDGFKFG